MRGDLNRRPVQWLRLWRVTLTGGKPDLQCGRRRAFAVALLAMNCACCGHFVRRCIAPFPHPAAARHCAPLQAQAQNPIAPSGWPPPPKQHGGARFRQALLSGQRLHYAQASRRAARALLRVHTPGRLKNPVAHAKASVLGAVIFKAKAARERARASPLQALASTP